MKLRNKKTGEIVEGLISAYGISGDVAVSVMDSNAKSGYTDLGRYENLTELNEEWEDYKPKEPLIKDEKIRKVVRAWAKINDVKELNYIVDENSLQDIFRNSISFNRVLDLKDGEQYTIDELCGEEKE